MHIKAATLIKKKLVKVLNLKLPKLSRGQILVKIKYTSICHTQLQEIDGLRGRDRFLPHCLGHEATGIVLKTGKSVKKVKKNDKVCLSWVTSDGINAGGSKYYHKTKIINAGPINTFSNYTIVSENKVLKLPKFANLKRDVLMGCAIPTAFNAVFNVLKNSNKENIIILGCGGLGLVCIYAAKLKNYKNIYAIDKYLSKLKLAKKFGANKIINSNNKNYKNFIKNHQNFFNNGIECSGNLDVMKDGLSMIKNFGGKYVIIGNYPIGRFVKLNPWNFITGKIVTGAWTDQVSYSKKFKIFYKKIYKFKWKKYFSDKIYNLENINQALSDFKKGKIIRPLIKI
tara:strand:+ start:1625 stop:2647 length:1023 start_codon:yes stop_codon:yes gene_type:complete